MEGYNYKKTDSHCLYSNIDKYGVEAAVKDVDPEGAWALVWWDKVDNRLCFLRNDKRPLWFAWTKDKTAVFWASEPWMFGAVSRHVELWDGKEEGKDPVSPYFQLPTNTCWSFTVNGVVKANERYLTFHQPREVKAEGKKHVGFWRPSSGNGGEVTNPFSPEGAAEAAYRRFHGRNKDSLTLDDKVDDIPLGVSTSTNGSLTKSETGSSNVLDFRLGGKHGSNSKKKTLSLPGLPSNDSQQNNKGSGLDGSQKSCSKMSNQTSQPFPHVSVRDVIGTDYITHNGSGCEIPLHEFEARTGSRCSYCGTLIGDLSEVAAFTNRAMTGFVCMSCVEEPKVAVVG
jgi:hypothetical protein